LQKAHSPAKTGGVRVHHSQLRLEVDASLLEVDVASVLEIVDIYFVSVRGDKFELVVPGRTINSLTVPDAGSTSTHLAEF
jgi:hypothetical protein